MEKTLKLKLLSYLLISAFSFSWLILPPKAGISVPIFVIIQFACLFAVLPRKKPLFLFGPIFILALNPFLSESDIWRVPNFFVTLLLYSLMVLMADEDYEAGDSSLAFIRDLTKTAVRPFAFFRLPVQWGLESGREQGQLMKRILGGILVSLPCLAVIITLLSAADDIFARHVDQLLAGSHSWVSLSSLFKWAGGLGAGFYLFGLACLAHQPRPGSEINFQIEFKDLLIINIALSAVLAVYTVFALIQFKYLFAGGGELPYGLNYAHYARRGFFELLFLSVVNISAILLVVNLTREAAGPAFTATKYLCGYLCLITFVLLVSSFYRMWLYNADGGLTRLRFLVFGFLVFEALGLAFTFIYIIRPRFNIALAYFLLGLTYYLLLNVLPMDLLIARSQVDRYLAAGKGDLPYVLSLSSDAAPEVARLLAGDVPPRVKAEARKYFTRRIIIYGQTPGWQKYNLSAEKCRRLFEREAAGE